VDESSSAIDELLDHEQPGADSNHRERERLAPGEDDHGTGEHQKRRDDTRAKVESRCLHGVHPLSD
jgi:hypothetical protein